MMTEQKSFQQSILIVSVLCGFLFAGCSDDSDNSPAMVSKLNGKTWKAQTWEGTSDGTALYLTGTASDGSRIDIYLANGGEGSTIIAGGDSGTIPENFVRYVEPDLNLGFLSIYKPKLIAGEIIITELDKVNQTISCTFFSDLTDLHQGNPDLTLSDGKITRIQYQSGEIDYEKPDLPLSIMFAKVNGIPMVFSPAYVASGAGHREPGFRNGRENKWISISFPSDASPGSYDLDFYEPYFATFQMASTMNESDAGTLNITSHVINRHRVQCTFNFTAGSGIFRTTITDGVMAATY
jgi:hypothetical protein